MGKIRQPLVKLSVSDARAVMFIIRHQMDDNRKVTSEYGTYETYRSLNDRLAVLQAKLVKQIPSGVK